MLVTGEADVKHSWVGIVIAPKATVSEDSRVIISTKAALIIAAAVLGGFGLVALAFALGMRRVVRRGATLPLPSLQTLQSVQRSLPSLHELQSRVNLPDLSAVQERLIRRRA